MIGWLRDVYVGVCVVVHCGFESARSVEEKEMEDSNDIVIEAWQFMSCMEMYFWRELHAFPLLFATSL